MLTADILKLKSNDCMGTVRSVLEEKDISSMYHRVIREEMRKAGVNLVPLYVDDDMLRNGHHRVKMAMSLGHEEMIVSDWEHECGYEEGLRKEVEYHVSGDNKYSRVPAMAG